MSRWSLALISRLDVAGADDLERLPLAHCPDGLLRAYLLRPAGEGDALLIGFCSDAAEPSRRWPGGTYSVARELRVAEWRSGDAAAQSAGLL